MTKTEAVLCKTQWEEINFLVGFLLGILFTASIVGAVFLAVGFLSVA
jgi:hypothetical protein